MKLLFVCLGNICRSPLAEAIFTHKAKGLGLNVEADSAGFERFHDGDHADPRSVAVAKAHGIDLNGHIARMFSPRDFDHYDRIYVMDRNNYNDVMGVARDTADEQKVDYMLNLVHPGENRPVPDPWYGGKDGFEKVFQMLDQACNALIKEISPSHLFTSSPLP
jgi:protein-tyrosine phosphatase